MPHGFSPCADHSFHRCHISALPHVFVDMDAFAFVLAPNTGMTLNHSNIDSYVSKRTQVLHHCTSMTASYSVNAPWLVVSTTGRRDLFHVISRPLFTCVPTIPPPKISDKGRLKNFLENFDKRHHFIPRLGERVAGNLYE